MIITLKVVLSYLNIDILKKESTTFKVIIKIKYRLVL